jgi:hypothetical protein
MGGSIDGDRSAVLSYIPRRKYLGIHNSCGHSFFEVEVMAILGVLLGITVTVLGGCIWWGRDKVSMLEAMEASMVERIAVLERRRSYLPEVSTGAPTEPEQVKVAKMRPISWSQARDAAEAGETK